MLKPLNSLQWDTQSVLGGAGIWIQSSDPISSIFPHRCECDERSLKDSAWCLYRGVWCVMEVGGEGRVERWRASEFLLPLQRPTWVVHCAWAFLVAGNLRVPGQVEGGYWRPGDQDSWPFYMWHVIYSLQQDFVSGVSCLLCREGNWGTEVLTNLSSHGGL